MANEVKSKHKLAAEASNSEAKSRYTKTSTVLQQMGLLEYTLQTAKLSKENEQLQQKIDHLESEVNKSSQKVKQDLKTALTCDNGKLQNVSIGSPSLENDK